MVFFSVLCGLAYPLLMTGVAQAVFPHQANGSLIERDGEAVGSSLVGQEFTGPEYFHPRPSAAGRRLRRRSVVRLQPRPVQRGAGRACKDQSRPIREENGLPADARVPVDAVTASASGLDPHISPAYARLQAERIAKARGRS